MRHLVLLLGTTLSLGCATGRTNAPAAPRTEPRPVATVPTRPAPVTPAPVREADAENVERRFGFEEARVRRDAQRGEPSGDVEVLDDKRPAKPASKPAQQAPAAPPASGP